MALGLAQCMGNASKMLHQHEPRLSPWSGGKVICVR